MSIRLDLGICVTAAGLQRVSEVAQAISAAIAGPFNGASGGDIALVPRVVSGSAIDIDLPEAVQSDQLHRSLESVTGRQRNETKVTQIGILLAGFYQPRPDFFGLMFDQDFVPGTSNPWISTPREGCAVFLSAIARKRSDADYLDEAVYTAVHELGHVVNLQHSPEPSFMATSASSPSPFALTTRAFDTLQCEMLSQCSTSRFVWPGGSAFGDLGPFAAGTSTVDAGANSGERLRLKIGVQQDAFWPFEPVELDVQLSIDAPARTRVTVPDMVDPGYQRFAIWIEEPGGERRRYRSPRHYCEHRGRLTISPGNPIRRDISIFGQSGGFCFQRAGLHKVFVTYEITPGRVIRSNVLELFVRPPGDTGYFKAAATAMSDKDLGQLLYHRRLSRTRARKAHQLADLCAAYPRQPSIANVHYALGRALAQRSRERSSGALAGEAATHLRAAVRRKSLGDHRRAHAEQALQALPSAKPDK